MGKPINALDQPDLQRFLATLPEDGELRRRAAAFAATVEPLAAVRQRPRAIAERNAAIDTTLIDATTKESAVLLGERATLATETLTLPTKAEALARRFALAELSYLSRARSLIHAAGTTCAAELAPHHTRGGAIQKSIILMENSHRNGAEKFAELAKLREELREVANAAKPLNARVDAAQLALDAIAGLARQRYGERTEVAQEGAHPQVAQDYGQRAVRSLKAA